MNKLFRPKCLRRVFLCLALLFPIVYLCGGLFFALAGAHGEQLFSDNKDTSLNINANFNQYGYINVNDGVYSSGGPNQFATADFISVKDYETNTLTLSIIENANNSITLYKYDNEKNYLGYLREFSNIITTPINWEGYVRFYVYSPNELNQVFNLSIDGDLFLPSLNASSYSDYIFSQPFETNNFITSLGKDLVNGSTKGFNPMNELFRLINTNIMHFDDSDNLAMFGLGYVYYAVNVLIIYEILILAVKLIMLPLKAVDLFDKKEDI